MTLHDRLKPVPADTPPPGGGWRTMAVGTVLAVLAAGFALAMPLAAYRPATHSGQRSPPEAKPLASPSVQPPAVTLPSPVAPARPDHNNEVADTASDPETEQAHDAPAESGPGTTVRTRPKPISEPRSTAPAPNPQPESKGKNKRAPDARSDHDKGYGNDPGRDSGPKDETKDKRRGKK